MNFNIRGIVDLDQLADILSNLVDHVNNQNNVIADLENKMSNYINYQVFEEKYRKLVTAITGLESQVHAIQSAATAKIYNKT